jgi:hypothetical protein
MLLEARHMTMQHRYHALRMNTHDIRLHDFGTVCGLRVDPHPAPECVNRFVILRPGIALDCCGREIVVPDDLYVPLTDGARSGWCGAPAAATPAPAPAPAPRRTLYILLRYQECDTDPIPSYVRACGCCESPCEHGDCVPSATREGYEVTVSTTPPPPPRRSPAGDAFCAWLSKELGASPQSAIATAAQTTLQHALCEAVTAPCADFCGGGDDVLLLATVTFKADDTLDAIDNCTNRRLVLSTRAIVEAIECLSTAVIGCCGGHPALTPLALTGAVVPSAVSLPSASSELTYTVSVENSTAAPTTAFTIELQLDPGLTLTSADLDGTTEAPGPDPAKVAVAVAALAANTTTTLTVVAQFDASTLHDGDVITSTATVTGYSGIVAPAVLPLATTVAIPVEVVDGPHVVLRDDRYKKFYPNENPPGLPRAVALESVPGLLRDPGLQFLFDAAMDTDRPHSGSDGEGLVAVELIAIDSAGGEKRRPAVVTVRWEADDLLLVPVDAQAVQWFLAAVKSSGRGSIVVTLVGGADGGPDPAAATFRSAAPASRFLDGDLPAAGPPPNTSGNGIQGGDFIWTITVTP